MNGAFVLLTLGATFGGTVVGAWFAACWVREEVFPQALADARMQWALDALVEAAVPERLRYDLVEDLTRYARSQARRVAEDGLSMETAMNRVRAYADRLSNPAVVVTVGKVAVGPDLRIGHPRRPAPDVPMTTIAVPTVGRSGREDSCGSYGSGGDSSCGSYGSGSYGGGDSSCGSYDSGSAGGACAGGGD